MKTVSYSLDQETQEGIEQLARSRKVSKSDIVREMYARMQLEKTLEDMQAEASPLLKKLGLHIEDDIARYARPKR